MDQFSNSWISISKISSKDDKNLLASIDHDRFQKGYFEIVYKIVNIDTKAHKERDLLNFQIEHFHRIK